MGRKTPPCDVGLREQKLRFNVHQTPNYSPFHHDDCQTPHFSPPLPSCYLLGIFGGNSDNLKGLQAEVSPEDGGVIITYLRKVVLNGDGTGNESFSYGYS